MSEESQAVDVLERLAVQLEGVQFAAKKLREVVSAKGMLASMQSQMEQAKADLDKAKAAMTAALEEQASARAQASSIVSMAKGEAEKTVKDAHEKAAKILQEATETGATELANARAGHDGKLAGIKKQIADAEKKLKDLGDRTVKATAEAEMAEKRAAEAQASFSAIQEAAAKLAGK